MLCCRVSEEEKQQRLINQEINERIKRDKKEAKREFKVLLLGTGEAGKSTFLKQMNILHGEGFTYQEKVEYIELVFKNLVMSIQTIIVAMDKLNISYDSDENQDLANKLMIIDYDTVRTLEEQYIIAIETLWSDNGIQQCYNRRREYQLIDSAWHYLSNINRIGQPDYLPSIEDILICRKMTNSICEKTFVLGSRIVRMVDVGGQRSERRKWIRCFDNVELVIFLVAISEFDQTLYEDNNARRMEESRELFKHINTAIWFENSTFVLFLNKKDLLEEKIKYSHLVDYFPDFKGPKHDVVSAREYIRDMFVNNRKKMYSHFTCATDTENINKVFSTVRISIMHDILGDFTLS